MNLKLKMTQQQQQDDDLRLMLLAIEQMELSVHEARADGKATPRVGAVLIKPDGKTEMAYRGELREGDHAEFTLLERKNRSNRLDGSILVTTLEPCAPGAREHPKLSCAQRIVLARIKEVWIGIEDPDPKVDRKGIKYLQDNKVVIKMFPRKLQETIREKNKEFIAQAELRAQSPEIEKAKTVQLSRMELAVPNAGLEDLSRDALQYYISEAKILDHPDSSAFHQMLLQQGLLIKSNGTLVPSGYGILLFGTEPRNFIPQAGLLATVLDENAAVVDKQDFVGPLVLIPNQFEKWLMLRLPNAITRTTMRRREQADELQTVIREAMINAMLHRDYDIEGIPCQFKLSPTGVTIESPGKPLPPITLEQLQTFQAPALSRNPKLRYVFGRMRLAEERGLGMTTFESVHRSLGLEKPTYFQREPYLVLQLLTEKEAIRQPPEPPVLMPSLNEDEKNGLKYLNTEISATKTKYAIALGFDDRKAQRQLKKFVDLGLVRRHGKGPATYYEVVKK